MPVPACVHLQPSSAARLNAISTFIMRLLNTDTLKLEFFLEDIPPYVILSHTWGKEEVTFDDIDKLYAKEMTGYYKIEQCCRQAALDGFEWVWIDTCSIDKRSSSELQEAINSMYQWYWDAQICYAYLEDVSADDGTFSKSRWFTRGWTLQELLAPLVVEFFDRRWRCFGTKLSLVKDIELATNIDRKYLLDRETIAAANIAAKFSWVSQRETTRLEDIAYCLLGLVDVNMPMLYGEGRKAFYRLQLEVLKKTNEHSIFAWEDPLQQLRGILAPTPFYFSKAGQYSSGCYESSTHEMTNKGLRITLEHEYSQFYSGSRLAVFNCRNSSDKYVAIRLTRDQYGVYHRAPGCGLEYVYAEDYPRSQMYIVADEPVASPDHPTAFSIQVVEGEEGVSSYEIEGVIVEGVSSPYVWSGSALETVRQEPLMLYVRSGGLWFGRGESNFLLGFGHHNKQTWLKVVSNVSKFDVLAAVEKMMTESGQWGSLRDYLDVVLADGTRVLATVKRRRSRGKAPMWHLTVSVEATGGGLA